MSEKDKEGVGTKRGFQGGGRNDAKRKKLDIPTGSRGVILTFNGTTGPKAVREFLHFIKAYSVVPGYSLQSKSQNQEEDVEASIAAEAAQVQTDIDRFIPINNLIRGVSFIKFAHPDDIPSEIVCRLFNKIKEGDKKISCRFVNRIIPIDDTSKPYPDDFEKMARKYVATKFPTSAVATEGKDEETCSSATPTAWSCLFNHRSMKTLQRNDVVDLVGKLMGTKSFKVDLNNPKISLMIEVTPIFCGISSVKDYLEFSKYNLYRYLHPNEGSAEGQAEVKPPAEVKPSGGEAS